MFKASATMCLSPQCAGRTRSPPRCQLSSKGQVRERVVLIVAVIPLCRLGLPRLHRSYGSVLNLVAATGPDLGDVAHELLSDHTLQRDAAALVEVTAKTSLEDRPGFGALLYLAGILVAVGVFHEGVAVVFSAHDLELQADLRPEGIRRFGRKYLQSAHLLRNDLFWRKAYFC